MAVSRPARMAVVPRAEFLGSSVNQVSIAVGRTGAHMTASLSGVPGALDRPRSPGGGAAPLVTAQHTVARRFAAVAGAKLLPSPLSFHPCPAQIMILSTGLCLAAGRFGLAPTANRHTTAGLKLYEDKSAGVLSNDPAGKHQPDMRGPVRACSGRQAVPRWFYFKLRTRNPHVCSCSCCRSHRCGCAGTRRLWPRHRCRHCAGLERHRQPLRCLHRCGEEGPRRLGNHWVCSELLEGILVP